MQINLIHNNNSDRLILIFAGWGMDERPFRGLTHGDYDIAVAYDYRTLSDCNLTLLDSYNEICVIAWSFGVPAANAFLDSHQSLPVTARIAVNGTLHPVDDHLGIPRAIFDGTLSALSPATLTKFERRMCGTSALFSEFKEHAPARVEIDELADELRAIDHLPAPASADKLNWDTIFVSDSDRIIPTENQLHAWEGHSHIVSLPGPHLPDFATLLRSAIVSKPLVATRFTRSAESYHTSAEAQRIIAARLSQLIKEATTDTHRQAEILEIGCGTGFLTNQIAELYPEATLTLWDIAPISPELPGKHRQCDAEAEIRSTADHSLDLIASASTIQWFNSPGAFVRNCRNKLRGDGLLALSTFGPDNFAELRPHLPSPLHYPDAEQWRRMLLTAGYNIITISEERIEKRFTDTAMLLRHISQTGVNALPSGPAPAALTRSLLNSGITTLTYHPIYILARPAQQNAK